MSASLVGSEMCIRDRRTRQCIGAARVSPCTSARTGATSNMLQRSSAAACALPQSATTGC
eukprot:3522196-Alexandrium_andersonii.AAC.1